MSVKWSERELGHLRMMLERHQSHSVHEMSQLAHKTIKRRSANAIGHKLRELIAEQEFKDDHLEVDGIVYPATVISGYVILTLPDGSFHPAHLFIWERVYGPIPLGYHVHHINGRSYDNRVINLQLMSAPDHIALHTAGRPPETAALFWFLQEKGLWTEYLNYRETILTRLNLTSGIS
jgi:hypothetical protein